jgi:D-aspartate ligase
MIPAIVIGTHTMGLGVIRALGTMRVPIVAAYYNTNDMGYVSRYVQERIHVPHPELDENLFIDTLIKLSSRFPNVPLFPVSDESLKIVAKHKVQLQEYFKVACAEWDVVRQFIEKDNTYSLAAAVGIPIPKTIRPSSEEEVASFGEDLVFPCLVKPVESHLYFALFKRKIVRVENVDQMLTAYRQAAAARLEVVLQELIPGEDSLGVNYNSYYWNGEATVEFTAQKIRNAPPELGSPCAAKSQVIPDVLAFGRRILKAMNFYGYSCTEFKQDPRDGIFKLMEVNGRHNLSTLLAVRCGMNFPWLHYQHLVDGIVPHQNTFQENIYWVDVERDLAYFSRQKTSLTQFLAPYFKPHVSAVLDWKDPAPFVKRYSDFIKKALRFKSKPINVN